MRLNGQIVTITENYRTLREEMETGNKISIQLPVIKRLTGQPSFCKHFLMESRNRLLDRATVPL